jgi:hypothetical protein
MTKWSRLVDHSKTETKSSGFLNARFLLKWTIRNPDLSGFRIPTVHTSITGPDIGHYIYFVSHLCF